jgi:tetratricopeptide (TPR) repeat protein
MTEDFPESSRFWKGLSIGLLIIVSIILFHSRVSDFDIFWHLSGGRWIVQSHRVPHLDPFSFTSSHKEWIDMHWLFQVMTYAAWQVAGMEGLILFRTLFLLGALLLVVYYGYQSRSTFAAVLGGLVFILIGQINFVTRPYIVTFLLLASALCILELHARRRGKEIFLIVPLMTLWVNSHGLFITGLGLIAAWGIGEFLDALRKRRLREDSRYIIRLALASALAAAVCLVNPYHVNGLLFPLELWTRISGEITTFSKGVTEFATPFSIPVWLGPVFFFKISILVVFLALILRGSKVRSAEVLIVILFGFLAFKAVRNLSLWAVVAGPVIGRNIGELLQAFSQRRPGRRAYILNHVLNAALCIILCAHILIYAHPGIRHRLYGPSMFGTGTLPGQFPQKAVEFMEEHKLHGDGFNCFEDGGYLIWKLFPKGYKVFIDGRLEVHDKAMYASYQQALQSPENLSSTLDRFNLDYALLRLDAAWAAAGLAMTPEWIPVFLDDVSLLIVRNIPEHEDLIKNYGIDLAGLTLDQAWNMTSHQGFRADRLENMAVVFMQLGRMEIARAFFKKASLTPGCDRAELFLGMEAFNRGDMTEAKGRLEKALKGSPQNRAVIHSMLAEIANKDKNIRAETYHLKKALQYRPEDCSLRERLGKAYLMDARLKKAVDEFMASLDCPAPPGTKARRWWELGMAFLAQGRLTDAEQAARKALDLDHGFPQAEQLLDEIKRMLEK